MAGTYPDLSDILMIVANVGAIMSTLAFRSEVERGSGSLDFVGNVLTNERTPFVVMPENALTVQDIP